MEGGNAEEAGNPLGGGDSSSLMKDEEEKEGGPVGESKGGT